MVSIKFVLNNCGVYEWIIVRISAVSIALYIVYVFSFILFYNNLSYEQWCSIVNNNVIKIFNFTTLLCILIHTWIGMRHILEDYTKSIVLKRFGIGLTLIILYTYLLLGIIIIWGT